MPPRLSPIALSRHETPRHKPLTPGITCLDAEGQRAAASAPWPGAPASQRRMSLPAGPRKGLGWPTPGRTPASMRQVPAGVAQLAEQPPCKRQVSGSNPLTGSQRSPVLALRAQRSPPRVSTRRQHSRISSPPRSYAMQITLNGFQIGNWPVRRPQVPGEARRVLWPQRGEHKRVGGIAAGKLAVAARPCNSRSRFYVVAL